jgi:hypothetical protein
MIHHLKSNTFSLFLLGLMSLTIAVKSAAREKNPVRPSKTNSLFASYAPDDLYVLSVEAEKFATLGKKKLVFKFIHIREETLTLHGFTAFGLSGRSFHDNPGKHVKPAIELTSTTTPCSTTTPGCKYTSDLYFGDVVLGRKGIKKIKRAIPKNKSKIFVLFTPYIDNGHIGYSISLEETKDKIPNLKDAITQANPSPPKNFQ